MTRFIDRFIGKYLMKTWKTIVSILLLCSLTSCKQFQFGSSWSGDFTQESSVANAFQSNLSEVTVPHTISELEPKLASYNPLVEIVSPRMGETLDRANLEIELKVTNLPLFKDERLKLGNHLVVAIDNETLPPIYDLEKPILLEDLTPGTHTIRAFAVKPWGESFKTEDAFAQTTFNVLTETNSNHPDSTLPLLTYNSPTGTYGAEPILLDFYLNYPEAIATNSNSRLKNVLVKVTINGTSFTIEKWSPYYLTGFKPGKNWVQLELVDEFGNSIENVFNNTVRVFNYDPQQQDTLALLVKDQIPLAEAKLIVEQNYYIQPVEVPEIIDSIDNTESKIGADESNIQANQEQLPIKFEPNTEKNQDVEPKTIKKESNVIDSSSTVNVEPDEFELDTLPTSSAKIKEEATEFESKLESESESESDTEKINTEIVEQSASSTFATPEALPNLLAINENTAEKVEIKTVPDEINIDIGTPQQPLAKIKTSETDTLPRSQPKISEPATQSEENRLSVSQSANSVAKDLPETETKTKFLWWKKLLVGIRQQIESLAKKLPREV